MAIKAAKQGDTLDLEMSGVVGDGWSDSPITSKATRKALKDAGDVATIKVKLNSPGGYVDEGLEIYQMLADHPAKVIVTVGAQASSCGSLISMAGDEIILHETSLFLIHNPWSLAIGDYQAMEKQAAELKMMAGVFAGAYAARSGMTVDEAKSLMDEDRYMDADEAKELGFCTKVIPSKKKPSSAEKKIATMDASKSFESMKLEARSRLERAAACALHPTTETPAQVAPETTHTKEDTMDLALLVVALGLTAGATEADAVASINTLKASKESEGKLLESLGAKSSADAIGRIEALKGSDERAAKAEGELAKIRDDAAKAKHSALIADALDPGSSSPHAGKLTPAQKAWAEGLIANAKKLEDIKSGTETLEGFLAVAPAVLKGDGKREPGSKEYSGKPYAEMSFTERHELAKSDPGLFKQLSEEHEAAQR